MNDSVENAVQNMDETNKAAAGRDATHLQQPNSLAPLVVDLDGTLVHTDLLVEGLNQFLTRQPLQFFLPLLWLARGRGNLKAELASRTSIDVASLPYNTDLIEWLKSEKAKGRRLVLATASHKHLATRVADHLKLFDEVIASDEQVNLKAQAKADALVARYGQRGFDYVGNDWPDLAVWAHAYVAHVVNAPAALLHRVKSLFNVGQVFETHRLSGTMAFFKALRVHQWLKNLLVFVPLFAAHQYTDLYRDQLALMAFFVFGITASSVYLLNDLVDVSFDRHHPRKRMRPFASGALSLLVGWMAWPLMFLLGFTLAWLYLPALFVGFLATYFVLTFAYSLYIKRLVIVDVLTLATLYTLRILAGAAAIAVPVSFWLLLLSMFLFLSLALVKRYSEMKSAQGSDQNTAIQGRGYWQEDLHWVANLGSATGLIAVLVLALYIQDVNTAHLYATPQLIWLVCPAFLFWISRVWMLTHRGQMHDDPIVFAIKDRVSWVLGAFVLMIFGLARVMP